MKKFLAVFLLVLVSGCYYPSANKVFLIKNDSTKEEYRASYYYQNDDGISVRTLDNELVKISGFYTITEVSK